MALSEKQSCMKMNLPEEMLTEILLKLPVKSLLRLSCVCKAWRALFRNPWFGDEHLNHNCNKNNQNVVFTRWWDTKSDGFKDQLLTHNSQSSLPVVIAGSHKLPYESWLNLVGSCNGILCLSEQNGRLVHLCNPTTREYMTLPNGLLTAEKIYTIKALGFGFDQSTNDYKVFRVAETRKRRVSEISNQRKLKLKCAEVYKLSTNGWSKLDADLTANTCTSPYGSRCGGGGVVINGFFHWWSEKSLDDFPFHILLILTFDFHSDIFGQIKCPSRKSGPLAVLDDSLVFLSKSRTGAFHLWAMREYGNPDSWTKKWSIGPTLSITNLLTCWNDDEKVIILSSDGHLTYCLLENGSIKIRTHALGHYLSSVVFQPTLVSLSRRCS